MESPTSIKNCPFCGGLAEFGVNSSDSWAIYCLKCRAKITQCLSTKYFPKGTFIRGSYQKTQVNLSKWAYKKLLPKWNKRTKL